MNLCYNKIDYLLGGTTLPSRFDSSETYIHELVEMFINFSNENLSLTSDLICNPSYTYITTLPDYNAFVLNKSNCSLIGINAGLFYHLFSKIVKDADNFINEDYSTFQLVILFLFYHEKAHIIQECSKRFDSLNESNQTEFNIRNYSREFDADMYACMMIIAHIKQFSAQIGITEIKLVSLLLSGLFLLFNLFLGISGIYFNERSHPHPLIRVLYIIDQFNRTIEKNKIENNTTCSLQELWLNEINFIMNDENHTLSELQELLSKYYSQIEDQVHSIQNDHNQYDDSAIRKDPMIEDNPFAQFQ